MSEINGKSGNIQRKLLCFVLLQNELAFSSSLMGVRLTNLLMYQHKTDPWIEQSDGPIEQHTDRMPNRPTDWRNDPSFLPTVPKTNQVTDRSKKKAKTEFDFSCLRFSEIDKFRVLAIFVVDTSSDADDMDGGWIDGLECTSFLTLKEKKEKC